MDLSGARPVPIVGTMKSYGQFCPVAKACEIVAERWTPLVLRELLCGSTRFSELQRGVHRSATISQALATGQN